MKILNLLPYSPVPPFFGGAMRMYHLLKHLPDIGEVSVLLYGEDGDEGRIRTALNDRVREITVLPPPIPWKGMRRRFTQLGAYLRGRSAGYAYSHNPVLQREIGKHLSRTDYDLILSTTHLMSLVDLSRSDAIKVLDAHNIEYDGFTRLAKNSRSITRKLFYKHEARACYREETETWRNQDAILCTSERDRMILDIHASSIPKFVIPNGVDTSYFKGTGGFQEPFSMVFTGAMNYPPNTDGVLFFLKRIFPLVLKQIPQAKLYVVGCAPPKELQKWSSANVVVTGMVDDVRPFIRRAALYIIPLQSGGGTRLKLLEALAMKKPVVTTSVGCEGIDVTHEQSVLVADNPDEFAMAVIELFRNPQKGLKLAETGHDIVCQMYDWSVIGSRFKDALQSVFSEKRGQVSAFVVGMKQ